MKLRAHHICCIRFLRLDLSDREQEYLQMEHDITETLLNSPNAQITVTEGTDQLCRLCVFYVEGRCDSPNGGEDAVRKWDAVLLKELGVPIGTNLTSEEWSKLIGQKSPFKLCQRCQWRQQCDMGRQFATHLK